MRIIDSVNVCLITRDGGEASVGHEECRVWFHLQTVWRELATRAKINCSFGFILEEMETKELRYYHSSSNNAAYYPYPKLITMEPMLQEFYDTLEQEDVKEILIRRKPDTRWRIRMVTNVTFYFFKLTGMGKIGASPKPKLVKNLKAILSLSKHQCTGKAFEDNLCFFRCLAVLLDCKCVGVKKKCSCKSAKAGSVQRLYDEFYKKNGLGGTDISAFEGVCIEDLLALERIFGVKIVVFESVGVDETNVVWVSA